MWGQDQDAGVEVCGTHLPPQTHKTYIYMWNNTHGKLTVTDRKTWNKVGRKEKWSDQDVIRRGRGLHRHRSSLRNEQSEPHIGHPSLSVQNWEDESIWPVGGQVELTGGLWEAWTLLKRSMYMLAYSWNRAKRLDWNCTGQKPVSCDCRGTCPNLSLVPLQPCLLEDTAWH